MHCVKHTIDYDADGECPCCILEKKLETKYKYPVAESCPIIHEDNDIQIYLNNSREVFIEHKKTGVTMRLNAQQKGLQFTAFGYRVDPVPIGGGIGWNIHI